MTLSEVRGGSGDPVGGRSEEVETRGGRAECRELCGGQVTLSEVCGGSGDPVGGRSEEVEARGGRAEHRELRGVSGKSEVAEEARRSTEEGEGGEGGPAGVRGSLRWSADVREGRRSRGGGPPGCGGRRGRWSPTRGGRTKEKLNPNPRKVALIPC